MRNLYLNTIDVTEISEVLNMAIEKTSKNQITEVVSLREAINKVTAQEVVAALSSPYYNASAMDGVAVMYEDTLEASEENEVTLKNFEYVNTGNPVPEPYNAVIMIEDIVSEEDTLTIIKPATLWQHIRPIGEDIVEGEMIVPKNHQIRPIDLNSLVAGGITEVEVYSTPVVGILPTGSEIIDNPNNIEVGKILDSNSYYLEAALNDLGATTILTRVLEDDLQALKTKVKELVDNVDILLVGAGTSAGTKDFTRRVIEEMGEVFIHGINIKPGKPTIIGRIDKTIVIGLPGYPVSTWMAFETVVKPLLNKLMHKRDELSVVRAYLGKKIYSSLKHHEYVRVRLGKVNGELVATPLNRGAAISMSLVKADGILVIDKNKEGLDKGYVDIIKLHNNDLNNNIVSTGSHDLLLDYLNDYLSEDDIKITSSHVGSMGGVLAIKRNECHIAPVHLLKNGKYNEHLISEYALDAILVKGPRRVQGIVTKKGNPKNIEFVEDLVNGVHFINRQRGSGTRILFDHLLKEKGISHSDILGYDYELTTHMTIVSAVENGKADAGMCVKSAIQNRNVDFIPLAEEHYDFLVHKSFVKSKQFKVFIKALKNHEFNIKLLNEGYVLDEIGTY